MKFTVILNSEREDEVIVYAKEKNSLVKSIEEKFNNSFKSIQNENAQVMEKLNQIQASQKKGMLLTGIGIAIIAVLCIVGFFI